MTSSTLRTRCPSISLDEIRHEDGSIPFQFDKGKVLGKGGEAIVYLGSLNAGQKKTLVAVKRLIYNSIDEFKSEIETMSKIHHSNTVSLLGYCDQSDMKILIYEYMEKGSLTNYIIPKAGGIVLSWKQRLNICLGAARGLQYLHTKTTEFSKGIIHRDIKPDNILIDENWVGKIADFGMVKLSEADQAKSTMRTNIKGTMGFYAPEYLNYGVVSRKIDVYAFGVVLFYVLCLKSPWIRAESYFRREDEDLGHYAKQHIDPKINEEISADSLIVYTDIIQGSLQLDPIKRPNMGTVVLNLEMALKCQNLQDEAKGGTRCPFISLHEIRHEDGSLPFQFDKGKVLGKGGEAIVYLGCLYIGQKKTLVAVKLLTYNAIHEFESEIETMSKINHSNTVSLLGYCNQLGKKILIYEYMEKGSLTKYLIPNSTILSWKQRLNICLGAARGLQYLHSKTDEFSKGIIHRDIKPDNILIDENWVGKIADFGMVKLSEADQAKSTMKTNIKGTMGFYAPEYLNFSIVSRKIDVYAFGVVLFYVLCLKSPWIRVESYFRREDEDLGLYAQQHIDTRIKEEISADSLKVYTDIIQRSLQLDPNKRPDISTVVLNLEKALKCQDEAKRATRNHEDGVPKIYPPGGEGKVVLYTSLGAIRKTNVACNAVKEILTDYHVEFEERDSSQDPNFIPELKKLVGTLTYPRLFMMGREIGLDNLHQNDQLFKSIQAITSN